MTTANEICASALLMLGVAPIGQAADAADAALALDTLNNIMHGFKARGADLSRFQRCTGGHRYPAAKPTQRIAKRAGTPVAEKATPQSTQRNGHDRYGCALHNPLDARPEFIHLAIPRELTFRENCQQISSGKPFGNTVQRGVVDLFIFAARTDGNRTAHPKNKI